MTITENALKKYRVLFEDFQESLRKYGRKYGVGLTQTRCEVPFEELVLKMMRASGAVR